MAQSFSGVITLTDANTNYNLYTLMATILTNVGRSFARIYFEAPQANSNAIARGNNSMADMVSGDKIFNALDTDVLQSGAGINSISATNIWLRSDGASQKLMIRADLY